ncbi:MAG: hypothetical protein R2715_21020 [Ilumatobacteraceae bacterium]
MTGRSSAPFPVTIVDGQARGVVEGGPAGAGRVSMDAETFLVLARPPHLEVVTGGRSRATRTSDERSSPFSMMI